VAEIGRRHGELGKLRLVVGRAEEQDVMTLKAECGRPGPELARAVESTMQATCKLRGSVELVEPGSLPNDGKVIADERKLE
jgi:phenylacetate-CoA ligase